MTSSSIGKVRPNGTPTFEIDAEAKKYLLSLPYSFTDDSSTTVKVDVVAVDEVKGQKPLENKTTNENSLNAFPGRVVVDDPGAKIGDMLVLEGALDVAAGKVVGEQSIKGHYEEGVTNAAGTFVFRYTLTPH